MAARAIMTYLNVGLLTMLSVKWRPEELASCAWPPCKAACNHASSSELSAPLLVLVLASIACCCGQTLMRQA